MDLNQILSPEMKTALTTLAGAAGLESVLGAMSNKVIKHQSFVLAGANKIFKALAVVFGGIGNCLDKIQDYGGKVSVETSPKGVKIEDASG